MIKLVLSVEPMAKQSISKGKNKKTGKDIFYTPDKKKKYQENLIKLIKIQKPLGFETLSKPVRVDRLRFYFAPTKTMLKCKKIKGKLDLGLSVYHIVRPDMIDNLKKMLFDSLTKAGVLKDDSIVCWENDVRKMYSYNPRIEIELSEIGEI